MPDVVNDFILRRYQEAIGGYLRSGESAVRRFAVLLWDSSPPQPGGSATEAWVYVTNQRLIFFSRSSGELIAEFSIADFVGARIHKQEVDLYFAGSGMPTVRRVWVRPFKHASTLVELAMASRDQVADAPLTEHAIAHVPRARASRFWASPQRTWRPFRQAAADI